MGGTRKCLSDGDSQGDGKIWRVVCTHETRRRSDGGSESESEGEGEDEETKEDGRDGNWVESF